MISERPKIYIIWLDFEIAQHSCKLIPLKRIIVLDTPISSAQIHKKSGTAKESCSRNQCVYVLQRSPVITRIMVI